jgi:hypothetical protein
VEIFDEIVRERGKLTFMSKDEASVKQISVKRAIEK